MIECMTSNRYDAVFVDSRIYDESHGHSIKLLRVMQVGRARSTVLLVSDTAPFQKPRDLAVDQVLLRPLSVGQILGAVTDLAHANAATRAPSDAVHASAAALPVVDFRVLAGHLEAGVTVTSLVQVLQSTVADVADTAARLSAMPGAWRHRTLAADMSRLNALARSIGAVALASCCSTWERLEREGKPDWVRRLLTEVNCHVIRLEGEVPVLTARIEALAKDEGK